ncbi:MAG TPA: sulfotransferase [Candidatus Binataceae bacterium]|nr:sulfotransferase [Candidatus Binataceae bacterium]
MSDAAESAERHRRLPDFIAVGPPRTATTWLYRALKGHIGLPRDLKETDFFSNNYGRGIEWYAELFGDCAAGVPIGELSPNYFADADAPERIARHLGRCRIVVTLRDPVARAYSFYRLLRHNGWTRGSMLELVDEYEPLRESNRYAFHVARWQSRFGRENVYIALYDDLETSEQGFLDGICDFIGAGRISLQGSPLAARRVNSVTRGPRIAALAEKAYRLRRWLEGRNQRYLIGALGKAGLWRFSFRGGGEFGPLDAGVEAELRRRFEPEVEALEKLIGRDLASWKTARGERGKSLSDAGSDQTV